MKRVKVKFAAIAVGVLVCSGSVALASDESVVADTGAGSGVSCEDGYFNYNFGAPMTYEGWYQR